MKLKRNPNIIQINTHTHTCMYTYRCRNLYRCRRISTKACLYCIHIHIHLHPHRQMHIQIHRHIHVHRHIHKYIWDTFLYIFHISLQTFYIQIFKCVYISVRVHIHVHIGFCVSPFSEVPNSSMGRG